MMQMQKEKEDEMKKKEEEIEKLRQQVENEKLSKK